MAGKLLISAVVTGLLLSSAVGAAPVAGQEPSAPVTDSSFIETAGSLGLVQQRLGKLAQEKGSSSSVKEFGKRMETDYSKVNEELATGAKQAAFPAPIMLRKDKQLVERFLRTSSSSFDKTYMAEMVKINKEQTQLFRQQSEGGRVQSLKQLATRMLPTMQQHLTLATQTAGSIGADVTASSSGTKQGT